MLEYSFRVDTLITTSYVKYVLIYYFRSLLKCLTFKVFTSTGTGTSKRPSLLCVLQYTNWVTPRKKINRASKSPNDVQHESEVVKEKDGGTNSNLYPMHI